MKDGRETKKNSRQNHSARKTGQTIGKNLELNALSLVVISIHDGAFWQLLLHHVSHHPDLT
jgi:hypothetical protein